MNDPRIDELEIRFSHLEHYTQELNSVVLEQQRLIESLHKQLMDLSGSVQSLEQVATTRTPADEKPPHY